MITPVDPASFSSVLKSETEVQSKLTQPKNLKGDAPEQSAAPSEPSTNQVNALFEGAEGNLIRFENQGSETVIKIIDKETDELIRQIPPEELMKMQSEMSDYTGQFIDQFV